MLAGVACSTSSQVHTILSQGLDGGFLFTIDLGGPLTPAHFPILLLRALHSEQSIH